MLCNSTSICLRNRLPSIAKCMNVNAPIDLNLYPHLSLSEINDNSQFDFAMITESLTKNCKDSGIVNTRIGLNCIRFYPYWKPMKIYNSTPPCLNRLRRIVRTLGLSSLARSCKIQVTRQSVKNRKICQLPIIVRISICIFRLVPIV